MMNDAFAALAVLAKHPRIDPGKIAVIMAAEATASPIPNADLRSTLFIAFLLR
jgi:hypothetical protein